MHRLCTFLKLLDLYFKFLNSRKFWAIECFLGDGEVSTFSNSNNGLFSNFDVFG